MGTRPVNVLSICSGVGGLDLAARLAVPHARTVCYVEREAWAIAYLAEAMEAGLLDAAPVWDDLATFNGEEWRGVVDLVIAGLPCQPWSVAGKQRGHDDERAIWPDFIRVVDECRPSLVFLENVPTFVTAGWFLRPGDELSRLGYELADPLFLRASDVGASHRRERVFILAHTRRQCRNGLQPDGLPGGSEEAAAGGEGAGMAHASQREHGLDEDRGRESGQGWEGTVADSEALGHPSGNDELRSGQHRTGRAVQAGGPGGELGNTCCPKLEAGMDESGELPTTTGASQCMGIDQECARTVAEQRSRRESVERGISARDAKGYAALPLFAPGPSDRDAWEFTLSRDPTLEPASEKAIGVVAAARRLYRLALTTGNRRSRGQASSQAFEPALRRVAYGSPAGLDHRVDRLRALGNMVVPMQGAVALSVLLKEVLL